MIHRRPPKLSLLPQLTKDTIDTAACQSILLLSMLTKRYHRWSPPQGNCKCRHPRKLSDAVTRQSTHHHRHLPRLSLTFPSSKAIADSAVLQSNHECCHPLKLSSMVFPTSPIMAGRTNHPLPAALSIYLPPGLPLNLSLLPPRAEAIGPASAEAILDLSFHRLPHFPLKLRTISPVSCRSYRPRRSCPRPDPPQNYPLMPAPTPINDNKMVRLEMMVNKIKEGHCEKNWALTV